MLGYHFSCGEPKEKPAILGVPRKKDPFRRRTTRVALWLSRARSSGLPSIEAPGAKQLTLTPDLGAIGSLRDGELWSFPLP